MIFWIVVAILTAGVAAVFLMPLLRPASGVLAAGIQDVAVYRDQMDELARDRKSGLISGDEAEFARAEVARRLIAATADVDTAAPRAASRGLNRLAQLAVILILPAAGLGIYMATGSPEVPDAPLAARLAHPDDDLNILIARAEHRLITNPEDGAGWDILAPIYYRSGRVEDAAFAFQKAIEIKGPSPQRLGGYAESLIALTGGLVTTDAQQALQKSLVLDPNDPRARFYLALALKQEGKAGEALAAFEKIAKTSPADAPWLPLVNQHIAELKTAAPDTASTQAAPGNPTADDVAAAQTMSTGDRQAMIRGMVDGLAAKLKDNPNNFEGWMRIIRSYAVLGEKDKAQEAVGQALAAFPAQGEQGKQVLALADELSLSPKGDAK